jgi:GDP-L-fucose synthase
LSSYSSARIYVAGHNGLVGSAIVRALIDGNYQQPIVRDRRDLDLRDQLAVRKWFSTERPDVVFLAAARVGGIGANNIYRWDFLSDNLEIQTNVLRAALDYGTERVVFFGSSCIYPKVTPQPIREDYLLTGPLEPTNEPYAIAKIAGLKQVDAANAQHGRAWVSIMPTNLYGRGDNFDLEGSHVLPAMLAKFHAAAQPGSDGKVQLWGDGTPRREFLHVDDLAAAALCVLESGERGLYNVGYGSDITISELAERVGEITGFSGTIEWDTSRPNGTMQKLLDSTKIRSLGWSPRILLEEGLKLTYEWFRREKQSAVEVNPVAQRPR